MLRELHVRNLAVLASATVEFGPGLNVVTGETGAGKSIVVDSLLLLAGARASGDRIRTGADRLTVTGVFAPSAGAWREILAGSGIENEGDEVLVRREVTRQGRNRVFVNDQPATARLLAALSPCLLRIHGQREELGLVDPELQRVWLDRSGGTEATGLLAATADSFRRWKELAERLDRLGGDDRARLGRIDLLRFQAREIDEAGLEAGEEETLRGRRDVLRNLEAITRALGESLSAILDDDASAADRLARSRNLLEGIAEWEPQAKAWAREVDEARIQIDEVASNLRRQLDGLEADPARLDAIESRLATIERLLRKYGSTTGEILEERARIDAELAELEGDTADREELEIRTAKALDAYREAASALSKARRKWGELLLTAISGELSGLGLGKARFDLDLGRRARSDSPLILEEPSGGGRGGEAVDFGASGYDRVGLLFSPNPGEELRPLARVASGGELSRIYLALQLAARAEDSEAGEPTLVFDEVDAGISGAQAAALGSKLQRLARRAQILAVTHLPQVASCADRHLKVSKAVRGGRTSTAVELLDERERIEEVARLLAGSEVTDLSLSHASELISSAARGSK